MGLGPSKKLLSARWSETTLLSDILRFSHLSDRGDSQSFDKASLDLLQNGRDLSLQRVFNGTGGSFLICTCDNKAFVNAA